MAKWIRHALEINAEIAIRIVDTEEGQQLNRDYREKDYPTNVLTFDYCTGPVMMADLVLCAPVVAREAAEQGKTLADHYAHLLVHGTLHAQGFEVAVETKIGGDHLEMARFPIRGERAQRDRHGD